MKPLYVSSLLTIFVLIFSSVPSCVFNNDADVLIIEGTVHLIDDDLDCWQIEATDGKYYEPVNLPSDFKQDGLRIHAHVILMNEFDSFCMAGYGIDVLGISRL